MESDITQIVQQYEAALLRYVDSILRDHSQAKDVVQDTLLKYVKLCELEVMEKPQAWLYKVAHNLALDVLRKRQCHKKSEEKLRLSMPENFQNPDEELKRKEDISLMKKSISELEDRERELLEMKVRDHKSYKEIAAETGLTVTNVGFILHSTMKKLGRIFRSIETKEVRYDL